MQRVDVAIVGGGVAGTALAFHLGRAGVAVGLLERAEVLGAHASGRNARLVLQSVAPPLLRQLTAASAAQYRARADAVGFSPCGSLLLGSATALQELRDPAIDSELVSPAEARRRVPLLREAAFEAALHTPGDGVLDPHRLLAWYRQQAAGAGVRFTLGCDVTRVTPIGGGWRLATSAGDVDAARLVIAAGAWTTEVAARAGLAPPPLAARKRHLFLVAHPLPANLPFTWDVGRELYLRADPEGTLVCMCDEEPSDLLVESVTADAEARMRAAFGGWLPTLSRAPLVRAWACFRTHAADGMPVVGPDPARQGLWWVAALGGHGLGSSWEVGRLAAEALLHGEDRLPPALRPRRLSRPPVDPVRPAPPAC